jgi:hypothetical protein
VRLPLLAPMERGLSVACRVARSLRAAKLADAAAAVAVLAIVVWYRFADRAVGQPGTGQPDLNVAVVPAAGPAGFCAAAHEGLSLVRASRQVHRCRIRRNGDRRLGLRPASRQWAQLHPVTLAAFLRPGRAGPGDRWHEPGRRGAGDASAARAARPDQGRAAVTAVDCCPAGLVRIVRV